MIQKIKASLLSVAALLVIGVPVLAPVGAFAAVSQTDINNNLCKGSNLDLSATTANCKNVNGAGSTVTDLITKIINILSVLVGALAVVMIIIGGFRYVTSGGSDSGVGAAKKTIMYALIGLVIVALAQIIVHFVLSNVT
jgi:hypothetical protein